MQNMAFRTQESYPYIVYKLHFAAAPFYILIKENIRIIHSNRGIMKIKDKQKQLNMDKKYDKIGKDI